MLNWSVLSEMRAWCGFEKRGKGSGWDIAHTVFQKYSGIPT